MSDNYDYTRPFQPVVKSAGAHLFQPETDYKFKSQFVSKFGNDPRDAKLTPKEALTAATFGALGGIVKAGWGHNTAQTVGHSVIEVPLGALAGIGLTAAAKLLKNHNNRADNVNFEYHKALSKII